MEEKIYQLLLDMKQDIKSINDRLTNVEDHIVSNMSNNEDIRHELAKLNIKIYKNNTNLNRIKARLHTMDI